MKCPRCRYISFDHNQQCPKCSKNLTDVQNVFTLLAYKANPPFLLGGLTGEVSDDDFEPEVMSLADIEGIEEEGLEIPLDIEVAEEPIQPSSEEHPARLHVQEDVSRDDAAPQQTPHDDAEMVTSEMERKKGEVFTDPEDFDLELDLEGLEDESA